MKNPSLIQLLYFIPDDRKQWPSFTDWLYALTFVSVFFIAIPWLMGA